MILRAVELAGVLLMVGAESSAFENDHCFSGSGHAAMARPISGSNAEAERFAPSIPGSGAVSAAKDRRST